MTPNPCRPLMRVTPAASCSDRALVIRATWLRGEEHDDAMAELRRRGLLVEEGRRREQRA